MLLPREQSPWNCGYFLGAVALKALEHASELDVEELRVRMSTHLGKPLSANQVMSAAAWLYLIDAIALTPQGKVVRCT
jgi:hypothetical protein